MTVPNPPISREDQSALNDLNWHWDTAYNIAFDGETWSASPLTEPAAVLTAESAEELRELIRADYHQNDRRNWREPL
jgi:hypothetical protein